MKKSCDCRWHKEYKFLLSLENKVDEKTYKKIYSVFEDKWMVEEDREYLKLIMNGQWPTSELIKCGRIAYTLLKQKLLSNLSYVEFMAALRKMEGRIK